MTSRAFFAGIIEQELVELAAQHLPGGGGFVLELLREIKRDGSAPTGADKLDAILAA